MGRWIGQAECTVDSVVPAAPAQVRAFYVDLDNMVRIHPLVVAVDVVGRGGGDGRRQRQGQEAHERGGEGGAE